MSKMKEEELLECLKDIHHSWKCLNEIIQYNFPDVYQDYIKKLIRKTEQAYKEIVALIKKEVSEEFIEEKANEMERMFLNDGIRRDKRVDRKDFIRSLIEEVGK